MEAGRHNRSRDTVHGEMLPFCSAAEGLVNILSRSGGDRRKERRGLFPEKQTYITYSIGLLRKKNTELDVHEEIT